MSAATPPAAPCLAAELLRACAGNVFAVAALLDVTLATAQHYSRAAVPDAVRALVDAMNADH